LGLSLASLIVAEAAAAPAEPIGLELNVLENVESRCRVSFVIENKGETALDTLRLELVLFSREGIVQRRLATEMGPVRAAKTTVKTFTLDNGCEGIGSILVNDVTACAPGDANICLDRLVLTSRVKDVKFHK
jgi:hypothetical protein